MRALTAAEDHEVLETLRALRESSGGTGLMHESFWFEDPGLWTREWFGMANSFFGEVILDIAEQRPHLLFDGDEDDELAARQSAARQSVAAAAAAVVV